MSEIIRILALGDVVGEAGSSYLADGRRLARIASQCGAHLIIANGENSAPGNGMTPHSAEALFDAGVDILTGGNHTWRRREVYPMLDDDIRIVRPANFSGAAPGAGYTTVSVGTCRVLVMNLCGRVYMEAVASPFTRADEILDEMQGRYDIAVLDVHAEATSEKIALARYLDGRVSAVFGTHTHVATADCGILPAGTGYITDLGMCGSHAGVLGVKTENIIHKFTVQTPIYFEAATGDESANGALFEIDPDSGKCTDAHSISF